MCTSSLFGVSGEVPEVANTAKQGQCCRCGMAIYVNMLCCVDSNGRLYCASSGNQAVFRVMRYREFWQILNGAPLDEFKVMAIAA